MIRLAAAFVLTLFALSGPCAAGAAGETGLFDLLQPGSRARPGIGGDPFASPLEDQTGWWAGSGGSLTPGIALNLETDQTLTRRATRNSGLLRRTLVSLRATAEAQVWGKRWLCSATFARPDEAAGWSSQKGAVSLRGVSHRSQLWARGLDLLPGLDLQVAGEPYRERGASGPGEAGAGLRYRRSDLLIIQGSWVRETDYRLLAGDLRGQYWAASLNLYKERIGFDGRLILPWKMAVEGTLARLHDSALSGRTQDPIFQWIPAGQGRMQQLAWTWRVRPRTSVILRQTRWSHELSGDLTFGGERFGHLDYGRARMTSILAGVERMSAGRGRWLLDAEDVQLRGNARAQVEFWPFSSVLADLLGTRRIGRLEGEARWQRLHLAHEGTVSRRCQGQFGLSWVNLRPSGLVDSWRPTFLVFGLSDYEKYPLRIRRVEAGMVSLGGSVAFSRFRARIHLQQVVYVHLSRSSVLPDQRENQESGPRAAGAIPVKGWPGGSQVSVEFGRSF